MIKDAFTGKERWRMEVERAERQLDEAEAKG